MATKCSTNYGKVLKVRPSDQKILLIRFGVPPQQRQKAVLSQTYTYIVNGAMISEELPEHQIFHILKQGAEEAIGPYSQIQIGQLLNDRPD